MATKSTLPNDLAYLEEQLKSELGVERFGKVKRWQWANDEMKSVIARAKAAKKTADEGAGILKKERDTREFERQQKGEDEAAAAGRERSAADREANKPFREKYPWLNSALPWAAPLSAPVVASALTAAKGRGNASTHRQWTKAIGRHEAAETASNAAAMAREKATITKFLDRHTAAEGRAGKWYNRVGRGVEKGWQNTSTVAASTALPYELRMLPTQYDASLPSENKDGQAARALIRDPKFYEDMAWNTVPLAGAGAIGGVKAGNLYPKPRAPVERSEGLLNPLPPASPPQPMPGGASQSAVPAPSPAVPPPPGPTPAPAPGPGPQPPRARNTYTPAHTGAASGLLDDLVAKLPARGSKAARPENDLTPDALNRAFVAAGLPPIPKRTLVKRAGGTRQAMDDIRTAGGDPRAASVRNLIMGRNGTLALPLAATLGAGGYAAGEEPFDLMSETEEPRRRGRIPYRERRDLMSTY